MPILKLWRIRAFENGERGADNNMKNTSHYNMNYNPIFENSSDFSPPELKNDKVEVKKKKEQLTDWTYVKKS